MFKVKPEWYCSECSVQFDWDDKVILISGGSITREHNGPTVDNNSWWDVYHERCYNAETVRAADMIKYHLKNSNGYSNMSIEARFAISKFDSATYVVIDMLTNSEYCVCTDYERSISAEERAKNIANYLNYCNKLS